LFVPFLIALAAVFLLAHPTISPVAVMALTGRCRPGLVHAGCSGSV